MTVVAARAAAGATRAGGRPRDPGRTIGQLRSAGKKDHEIRAHLRDQGYSDDVIANTMPGSDPKPNAKPAAAPAQKKPAPAGDAAAPESRGDASRPSRSPGWGGTAGGSGAGVLLAVVLYPAAMAYLKGGTPALRSWVAAKFLNRTSKDPGAAGASWAGDGPSVVTAGYTGGTTAVAASYSAPTASGGSAAVAFARSQVGKPYRYGANGPAEYDCSGLTKAAWAAAGVTLPRTTTLQLLVGSRVARADLAIGDLVFANPGHVGIYSGSGKIIEAPRTGLKVREVPIWGFMTARRPR